jgi:subtilisin family serine protease
MNHDNTNANDTEGSISRRQLLQSTAAAGVLSLLSTTGSAGGTTDVVVRAEEADVPLLASSASVVDELEATADESQQPIVDYAERTDGLAVKNRFWLANAVLLEVDTAEVDPAELAAQTGVSEVHPNFHVEIPEPEVRAASAAADGDVTYGLDQIDAPEAWETYGSRGEGARIAVLDTGVDPDHPDLDVAPENFAEFDGDGEQVDSDPHDSHYHGTHVSGTVAGGDASGTAIGVAPGAELLNGLILPDGGGTFAQIIAGMEWAVEQDADAMNMSLGVIGYAGQMVEPVRNAERAGTLVVSSSGNSGPNTSGSPANVYDSFAVGATDESEAVASFSSGEVVNTADAWGYLAPDDWPASYVVPDASAPGVDVTSAFPVDHSNGPYHAISGTSMASPHVAGLVGLMRSAAVEEADPEQVKTALRTTAWKPEGESDDPDYRYGTGVVDAMAAVGRLAADSGVTGTVTDADGNPLEGVTVELDGFQTETDANGEYTLRAVEGSYEVSVDAFGYAGETVTVDVTDGFVTRNFALGDDLAVTTTADQPDGLEAGEGFDVDLRVANAEALTVEQVGDFQSDAWLSVNGEEAAFGEQVVLDVGSGVVTVSVETVEGGYGDLELEHAVAGLGETVSVTTGPTSVYDRPTPVAIVDAPSGGYAADVEAILADEAHPRHQFSTLDPAEALSAAKNREHEAYVVQNLGDDEDLVAEFADVATAPEVGVVYLDQFGEASHAVSQLSASTGDPRDVSDAYVQMAAPPVSYAVDRSHPALDGIAEAGDAVTITEPDPVAVGPGLYVGGFHTYFEDYRGHAAGTTIAEAALGALETGDGLAVDDLSRTVVAASLGVGLFVDRDAFTPNGRALLGNLVEHAAQTPPVEVVEVPAERVTPGEAATARIEVENLTELEFGVSGLQFLDESDLTLSVDGELVPLGEPITYDEPRDGTVEVAVRTPSDVIGEFALDARFVTLDRRDREVETAATFRPTTVYESPIRVPDQLDDLQAAVDFVRPGDEVVVGGGTYALDAERGFQTGLYVGTPGITIRGAAGETAEIVHARDLPAPNIVNVDADDVTVENVSANVLGGEIDPKNLVGHGIRINDGVSGTTVRDVTAAATTGVFLDKDVSDVRVENATVFESPTGVGTDLAGGPVENVTVTDLTFEDPYFFGWGGVYLENADRVTVTDCEVTYETGYTAGIYVFGDFDGGTDARIANNVITGPDDDDPFIDSDNGIYVDGIEATIENNAIADTYVGIRVGQYGFGYNPPSVRIRGNTVENANTGYLQYGDRVTLEENVFEADTGLHFDGGYFGLSADSVAARYNDLSATDVPFRGEPDSGYGSPEGPFDARQNYLGDREYGDTIADGDVAYDPFLTAPPAEADLPEPTQLGTDLTLDPGGTYGLGVPGPTDRTIYDVLGVDGYGDFAGTVEVWDQNSGKWKEVTGEGNLAYVNTLYAFKVTPEEGVRAVVDFQRADDPPVGPDGTPPGHRDSELGRTHLQKGWNFVPAPQFGAQDEVFDPAVVDAVEDDLDSPGGQLGDGEKHAFAGYKVRATEDAWLKAGIDAYDPTMTEMYESLGLDPVIHEKAGADATASGETTPTVADVLEVAPDEETAADMIAALVGRRVGQRLATTDDLEAAANEAQAVAETAVRAASAADRDLVKDATHRAVGAALRAHFGAEIAEEDSDDFDSEAARTAAERSDDASASIDLTASALLD